MALFAAPAVVFVVTPVVEMPMMRRICLAGSTVCRAGFRSLHTAGFSLAFAAGEGFFSVHALVAASGLPFLAAFPVWTTVCAGAAFAAFARMLATGMRRRGGTLFFGAGAFLHGPHANSPTHGQHQRQGGH
ncbi:MAG: hypothetical protein KF690_04810 [Bacteroidetes bacterium]|nr:hypothetical protein [Bacteroidota bacterium]